MKLFCKVFVLVGVFFMGIFSTFMVLNHISSNHIKNYFSNKLVDKDTNYNFLYFDKDVSQDERQIFVDSLKYSDIYKLLDKSDIKIYVCNTNIKSALKRIGVVSKISVNNPAGLYLNKFNLLLIKTTDFYNMPVNSKNLSACKNISDTVMAKAKNHERILLKDIVDKKEIKDMQKKSYEKILYHEITHYLDFHYPSIISNTNDFRNVYSEECNTFFPNNTSDDAYFKSDAHEYLAECTSLYIQSNKYNDNDYYKKLNTKINNSQTKKYICKLLKYYKLNLK